jgi:ribosomal protein S12 methylthiotransferase
MYVSDELIAQIADSEKVLPYIDLPLQHISDRMLRRMARRVTRAETEDLLGRLRKGIENLVLRTTFITGFPDETDGDFEELAEFVRHQRFDRVGVFTYSPEPDTPAMKLADHVPEDLKQERRQRLMEIQQAVAFEANESRVGSVQDVILDQPVAGEDIVWVGRSYADAPDIDGVIYVTGGAHALRVGHLVRCEIVAAREYDLVAAATELPR